MKTLQYLELDDIEELFDEIYDDLFLDILWNYRRKASEIYDKYGYMPDEEPYLNSKGQYKNSEAKVEYDRKLQKWFEDTNFDPLDEECRDKIVERIREYITTEEL